MEEKKYIKISLSTFFLIIALIVICITGYFTYKYFEIIKTSNVDKVAVDNTNSNTNISDNKEIENEPNKENSTLSDIANNYEKSYSEIIKDLNTNNFDKNKFDGSFLIKKVNNLPMTGDNINYYNINGDLVDKYLPETVLATWSDISNYQSNLYNGLEINRKIPYSSQMIYRNNLPNETTFYLEANKTAYSAEETIEDSFNNNNVGLFWSAKDIENSISADEVITVPDELKQKWNYNELGIFIELLGNPSRVYTMPDTDGNNPGFHTEIEFDLIKNYQLFWEYDEYYIRMYVQSIIENDAEKINRIANIVVKSKNSNSSTGDYNKDIANCENSVQD